MTERGFAWWRRFVFVNMGMVWLFERTKSSWFRYYELGSWGLVKYFCRPTMVEKIWFCDLGLVCLFERTKFHRIRHHELESWGFEKHIGYTNDGGEDWFCGVWNWLLQGKKMPTGPR